VSAEVLCAVSSLAALTSVDLSYNPQSLTIKMLRTMSSLTGLTSLDLSHSDVDAAVLIAASNLTVLASLNLRGCRGVTVEGLRAVFMHTALKSLNLYGCGAVNAVLNSMSGGRRFLKALTSLDIGMAQVDTEGLRAVSILTALTSLDLTGTQITTEGLRAVSCLPQLTSLNLAAPVRLDITAEGLKAVRSIRTLTSLDLTNCIVTNQGLPGATPPYKIITAAAKRLLCERLPNLTIHESARRQFINTSTGWPLPPIPPPGWIQNVEAAAAEAAVAAAAEHA
jgi:hypothetical protein